MKLEIVVNKYLLIWHLLYQSTVSVEMNKLKQELWTNNKKEYSLVHKNKNDILLSLDDYIPDDDFIYNSIERSDIYKKVKIETNRYRNNLLEMWDKNRRKYVKELNSILKYDSKRVYKVCAVHPNLDFIETDFESNIITVGKRINARDKDNFLTYLMYKIVKNELSKLENIDPDILDIVSELATINELYTRVSKESKYSFGKKDLRELKEKIYPLWLMYLGVEFEDFESYMVRDNIFFDKNVYKYQKLFRTVDIYSFINFLMKNKKAIVKTKIKPVEKIEML